MPRLPRLRMPHMTLHIVQRGVNRAACFYSDDDRIYYLERLFEYAPQLDVAIHAWCLMTNHVHLLVTPATADGSSRLMKHVGQRYVQYVNRTWQRTGTLWEGRFRSCMVNTDGYLLACQRYIELNPVRAGMTRHPGHYRWSSYNHNAGTTPTDGVTPHATYLALGTDTATRTANYRALFNEALPATVIDNIRTATHQGLVLGNDRFRDQIEAATGQRTTHRHPGRPKRIGV